jgi:hypothetical protein
MREQSGFMPKSDIHTPPYDISTRLVDAGMWQVFLPRLHHVSGEANHFTSSGPRVTSDKCQDIKRRMGEKQRILLITEGKDRWQDRDVS